MTTNTDPTKGHTIPTKEGGDFWAMWQGQGDGLVRVLSIFQRDFGNMMVIPGPNGEVYITKEQARIFFGFK